MKLNKTELIEAIKRLNKENPLKEGKEIQRATLPADADALEQHQEALNQNIKRRDPKNYEKEVKDLIKDTASEESRYRHFDVVDRKDLAKKINEAKQRGLEFKISKSMKEGFRYDFKVADNSLNEDFLKKEAGDPEVNKDAFNHATDVGASSPTTDLGEELKIFTSSLTNFHPSKKSEELWNEICEKNKLQDLEAALEVIWPDGISDDALDDMLYNEADWVRDMIGLDGESTSSEEPTETEETEASDIDLEDEDEDVEPLEGDFEIDSEEEIEPIYDDEEDNQEVLDATEDEEEPEDEEDLGEGCGDTKEKETVEESWKDENPYDEPEEALAKKVAKACHLSIDDFDDLLHDLNNLRGDEWLDIVEKCGNDELIGEFKDFIHVDDDDDDLDESLNESITTIYKKPGDGKFSKLKAENPGAILINTEFETESDIEDKLGKLTKDSTVIIDGAENLPVGKGIIAKLKSLGCKVFLVRYDEPDIDMTDLGGIPLKNPEKYLHESDEKEEPSEDDWFDDEEVEPVAVADDLMDGLKGLKKDTPVEVKPIETQDGSLTVNSIDIKKEKDPDKAVVTVKVDDPAQTTPKEDELVIPDTENETNPTDDLVSSIAEGFMNSTFKPTQIITEEEDVTKQAVAQSQADGDDDEIVAVDDSMVEEMMGFPKAPKEEEPKKE